MIAHPGVFEQHRLDLIDENNQTKDKMQFLGKGQWIWEEYGGSEFDQSTTYKVLKELML